MKERYFWLSVLLICGAILWAGVAQGHELNKDDCSSQASDGITFAEKRDDGVSVDIAYHVVYMGLATRKGTPDSYIQDDEDVDRILKLMTDVWASPMSPGEVYQEVIKHCLKPEITVLPKGIKPTGPKIQS